MRLHTRLTFFIISVLSWVTSASTTEGHTRQNLSYSLSSWCDENEKAIFLAIVGPCLGFLFIALKYKSVISKPEGKGKQVAVNREIMKGAYGFMWAQYKTIAIFTVLIFILILLVLREPIDPLAGHSGGTTKKPYWQLALHFLSGALLSCLSGVVGMNMAIRANVRTTEACKDDQQGLPRGLRVAFDSGSVMGLSVVCFVVFGQACLFWIFRDPLALSGFGFGASIVALFARVGGGIFTKAADVGSDLVGKVEAGLPEDDPRNPGVIADNVGDNVGDVAGLGADLFESYVGATVAAVPLGISQYGMSGLALPFWISGMGIIASIIGTFFVSTKKDATSSDLLRALHLGTYVSSALVLVLSIPICLLLFDKDKQTGWELYACVVIGLLAGILIGYATEYFTSDAKPPTQAIAESATTGPATVIIQGFGVGMISTLVPGVILAFAALGVALLQGAYGVSIAAVGMLSTLGITLATDAYGPVADNAGGIAEMAELPPQVRERTDLLDALGNTTAATGKGFAIGSALLITLALISAFVEETVHDGQAITLDFADPYVLSGSLIGALLPFLFAALTMFAVGTSAQALIKEVRRQFKTIDGLKEGREGVSPQTERCVKICTNAALEEMVLPGVISVVCPLGFGYLFGAKFLGGILVGTILSGFFLASTMANAGGAWDNAKKFIERGDLNTMERNGVLVWPPPKIDNVEPESWDVDQVVQWAQYSGFGLWEGRFRSHKVTGSKLVGKKREVRDPEDLARYEITDPGMQRLMFKQLQALHVGKKSPHHEATVIGDTVGDPFKDTSGPALNILSKLMSHLALIISGSIGFETEKWLAGVIIWVVTFFFCAIWYWKKNQREEESENIENSFKLPGRDDIKQTDFTK